MTLQDYLDCWAEPDPACAAVAATLAALARASVKLAGLIADGPLAGDVAAVVGESEDGDGQKALDAHANALFRDALAVAPVSVLVSEEEPAPVRLRGGASLAVALDPLDGSNNIAINGPLATIFSLLPAAAGGDVMASSATGHVPTGRRVRPLRPAHILGADRPERGRPVHPRPAQRHLSTDASGALDSRGAGRVRGERLEPAPLDEAGL